MANPKDSGVDQGATTVVGGDLHVAVANLPELKNPPVVYESAAPDERAKIEELMESINLADTNSIIFLALKPRNT